MSNMMTSTTDVVALQQTRRNGTSDKVLLGLKTQRTTIVEWNLANLRMELVYIRLNNASPEIARRIELHEGA